MKMFAIAAAALLAVITPSTATAETAADQMVVTVVTVPTPPGLDDGKIAAGMHATIEQYRQLPGLIRKYYTIGQGTFGGVYLWRNRAAAEAWFNQAWHDRAIKTYGKDGTVTYFVVPETVDGVRK